MLFATYQGNAEAYEEDRRVAVGKRWHRPERHFFVPVGELPDDAPHERPVYAHQLSCDTPEERMAILIKLAPRNVFVVYRKAIDEGRWTIAELIPMVVAKLFRAGELEDRTAKYIRKAFGLLAKEEPIAQQIVAAVS